MESDEPSAYERAEAEIDRRSKVMAEAAAWNWGGSGPREEEATLVGEDGDDPTHDGQ